MDDVWQAFSQRLFDQNKFAIKLGLDNIRRAFELCGSPQASAPAIVVGGTNGKGTVASMVSAILQAHGLRVGLYTSPHLIEVRERFRVNGTPLEREEVMAVGRQVIDEFADPDECDPCLTFFELTTLMAARLFERADVDVAVYEVGLGGRLDAVNAIEPALTVITTIGLDHQQYLGDTIEEITAEKAALLRSDMPAAIGAQEYPAAEAVLRDVASIHHHFVDDAGDVIGRHRNTATRAAHLFLKDRYEVAKAREGLSRWVWPGRSDTRRVVHHGRALNIVFDAAHNLDGVRLLAKNLPHIDGWLFAAMADKLTPEMLETISDWRVEARWVVSLETPRAADPRVLADELDARCGDVCEALQAAFEESPEDATLLVFGSVYLLGEVFAELGMSADELRTYE